MVLHSEEIPSRPGSDKDNDGENNGIEQQLQQQGEENVADMEADNTADQERELTLDGPQTGPLEASELNEDLSAGDPDPSAKLEDTESDDDIENADADEKIKHHQKAKRKKKRSGKEVEPAKPVTILHMVFDQMGGEQIKLCFEQAPEIAGEMIYIEDNYSLGPVAALENPQGWLMRKVWWQAVLNLPEEEQPEVMASDKMKLHQLLQQLENDEDTVLWIWMGQNERDVAGYYHVISRLMAFQGRIQVLYLNNLPFIDEKGHIFYPRQLSEILPKEFVKAARLARVVTLSEFELDPEEWEKLTKQPGHVRLLEGGKKLIVKDNEYYDGLILDQLGVQTMKLHKLLTLLATKAKLGLPEYYIIWRIKELLENNQIISQGDFDKGPKSVTLKATRGEMFVELNPLEDEASESE